MLKACISLLVLPLAVLESTYATYGSRHWGESAHAIQDHSASSSQGSQNPLPPPPQYDSFGLIDLPLEGDGSATGWLQQSRAHDPVMYTSQAQHPHHNNHNWDSYQHPASSQIGDLYSMLSSSHAFSENAASPMIQPGYSPWPYQQYSDHEAAHGEQEQLNPHPQWAEESYMASAAQARQRSLGAQIASLEEVEDEGLASSSHEDATREGEAWYGEDSETPQAAFHPNMGDSVFLPATGDHPAWHLPSGLSEREASRAVLYEEWIRRKLSRNLNAQELAARVTEIKISHPSLAHSIGIMASGIVRSWHDAEYLYDYREWMTCYRSFMKALRRKLANKAHTSAELQKLYLDNIRSAWATHHGMLADPVQEARERRLAEMVWQDFHGRRLRGHIRKGATMQEILSLVATYSANYKYNMSMDRFASLRYIKKYLRLIANVPYTDIEELSKKTRSRGSSGGGYMSMPSIPP